MKKPEDLALEKAKIQLMMMPNTVFFTTILFSLKQVWDPAIQTAAVDGITLWIAPDDFLALPEKQRVAELAHEILHVALSHMTRKGNRNHEIFNGAGDYMINLQLKDAGYEIGKNWLYDDRFRDMTTEQIYDILYDEAQKNPTGLFGANGPGSPSGPDLIIPKNPGQLDAAAKAVADIVMKAGQMAKSANEQPGNAAGEIEKQLQSVINPKLPWNVIFQNYMNAICRDNFSWRRPNKRFLPDHYLPTAFSEAICNIAIAVDSSGSVYDEEFGFFIAEIATIQSDLKPEKITLIDFDTRIRDIQEITEGTDCFRDLKFTGGGGTDVRETLKWAKDNNPDVIAIFTDGEFSMPGDKYHPTCPVIWLIHDDPKWTAPFGEVVHYDMRD
jgi:predicted metal-dependent peptidase